MDGVKLEQWLRSFEAAVAGLQTEYDAFFLPHKFQDTYRLKIDETSQSLSLWIDSENLPKEMESRLTELLIKTEPEDGI